MSARDRSPSREPGSTRSPAPVNFIFVQREPVGVVGEKVGGLGQVWDLMLRADRGEFPQRSPLRS